MQATKALGRRGERVAARHYRRRGYRILARNLRLGRSEVDLLLLSPTGMDVVIVEVKASSRGLRAAGTALDQRKRHRIAAAARALEGAGLLAGHGLRVDGILVDCSGRRPRVTALEGCRIFHPGQGGRPGAVGGR